MDRMVKAAAAERYAKYKHGGDRQSKVNPAGTLKSVQDVATEVGRASMFRIRQVRLAAEADSAAPELYEVDARKFRDCESLIFGSPRLAPRFDLLISAERGGGLSAARRPCHPTTNTSICLPMNDSVGRWRADPGGFERRFRA
jgi:hypothetical protein